MGEVIQAFKNECQEQINLVHEWLENYKSYTSLGHCAAYIPALERADASQLGIYMIGADGTTIKSGDWDVPFTLQSISKVISFMDACIEFGIPYVLERVDVEPTGDAFNSIVRLEMHATGRPFNPMINAGAITVSSLLGNKTPQEKVESFCDFIGKMTGKKHVVNEEVFESEWQTAHRNRSIAYYLKETGFLECSVEEALEVYLRQCSIEVSSEDIAMIGLILSHDGYNPLRKEQVFSKEVARITKALMVTCGMYNASGKFAAFVGVPAKSGVSGGILAAIPPSSRTHDNPFSNGCGIGIYGPAIDEFGNSVAGVKLLEHITKTWDFTIF